MTGWNFAELWERIADKQPDAQALVHGERRYTWAQFNRRANALANYLINGPEGDAGQTAQTQAGQTQHQDKVALYVYNCPEYMEASFACYKAGLVPVNTNYRYVEDELAYLWDNADAVAVVFHGSFTDRVDAVRPKVPGVRDWIWVDDGSGSCPEWAVSYAQIVSGADSDLVSGADSAPESELPNVTAAWGRSGDDIVMIYTGGTTGMPKGTMWRQDDLIRATCATSNPTLLEDPESVGYDAALANVGLLKVPGLPACPLMHGTGWFTANIYLSGGGSIVTLPGRSFDVAELLDTITNEKIGALTIVGDAFAKPILAAIDEHPGRWDISSLMLVSSSGVMWSEATKSALLEINPTMLLIDSFSSSEAIGMGQSVSAAGASAQTAKFSLGEKAKVITEAGELVQPGSGERGRVAVGGFVPLGYYKDPEKTAATFITIEGRRYSCPGDWATVEEDGSITLLGRGSVCINTAGEKVFPEEVEEVLKLDDGVYDAVVVGVPDERFGEMIVAVVEPTEAARAAATERESDLIAHVKGRLASYKAPKHVLIVDSIGRAPNAKVDYRRWKSYAQEQLA